MAAGRGKESKLYRNILGRPDRLDQDPANAPGGAGGAWRRTLIMAGFLAGLVLGCGSEPARALSPGAREQALRALEAADAGRWDRAEALARAVRSQPLLDYLTWQRLRDRAATAPIDAYSSFLAAHADWPGLALLQARAEELLASSADDDAVRRFFAATPPVSGPGRLRLAAALLAAGEEAEGTALLRRAWIEDDLSEAEERLTLSRFAGRLRAEDHRARLDRLAWDNKAQAARRLLPKVDAGQRALIEARLRLRATAPGVDQAVAAVPPALVDDPGLAYERIRWRRLKGQDEGAQALLLAAPQRLGRPDLWWDERAIQVRRALEAGNGRLAYRLAAGHGLADGADFAEAEWLAGWLALRYAGEPKRALAHFAAMAASVRTPISRARGTYWAGRAAAALGRADEARHWYGQASALPQTFYGQLAASELGLLLEPAKAVVPAAAEHADLSGSSLARATRLLCELRADSRAVPLIGQLARNAGDDATARAVLRLARGCARPDPLLRAAKALPPERAVTLDATHPVPPLKALTARRPSVPDAALRLAVTRQESQFDPTARSPAGARGLMQLMPPTARAMARELGLPFAVDRLTRDPDYNARLGSRYLERQLARFDGELALALAAYNAGPGRVVDWLAANGDPRRGDLHDLIDWIERIPFAETRNYVQRVIESREVYARLLQAPETARLVAVPAVPTQRAEDAGGDGPS